MIRFFKSPQPAALFVIPFIIIALWLRIGLSCSPVVDETSLPLWKSIGNALSILPGWLNFILLVSLLSFEAIYFNLMVNKHEVLYKSSYLPSLLFAFIISSTPGLIQFHPVHLVNLLVLIIFDRTFSMFKNEKANSALFDSSFLTGIAALIYFPSLLLMVVLVISLSILRPFKLKEWIIVIIGFSLPFFFASVYSFWNHALWPFWTHYFSFFPSDRPIFLITKNTALLTLTVTIGSLLFFSLLKLRVNHNKNVIRTRSFQQIFFFFLLLCGISIGISRHIQIIHFAILAIPVSLFISYFYLSAKKRIRLYEFTLWAFIVIVLWNQFTA